MKAVKQLVKMIGAAIIAVIILSLIVSIYSTSPLRVENPQGNTDYVWKPNSLWINLSEGVSFGRMDDGGFNNLEVIKDPKIILLGSSHIESKNVNQNENTSYYLQEILDNKYSIYNMGISGHTIYKACQYLPQTLSIYGENVPEYVVIETDDIDLTKEDVNAVLNQTVEKTPVYDKGLLVSLQKVPAFRQFYHQLDSGMMELLLPELKPANFDQQSNLIDNASSSEPQENAQLEDNPQYDELMSYLADIEEQYDTNIIIIFHPFEKLNEDGTLSFTNNRKTDLFAESAEKNGITYIDMTDCFERLYTEKHHVPHGFITGKIGSGHLNKYGHEAIADALSDAITETEA